MTLHCRLLITCKLLHIRNRCILILRGVWRPAIGSNVNWIQRASLCLPGMPVQVARWQIQTGIRHPILVANQKRHLQPWGGGISTLRRKIGLQRFYRHLVTTTHTTTQTTHTTTHRGRIDRKCSIDCSQFSRVSFFTYFIKSPSNSTQGVKNN